jgi:hypothetical protein
MGSNDNFSAVWQSNPVNGDVTVKARVVSNTDSSTYSAGCVMIRETDDIDAPYVATCVSPQKGVTYRRRASKGAKTQITAGLTDTANVTVRLSVSATALSLVLAAEEMRLALRSEKKHSISQRSQRLVCLPDLQMLAQKMSPCLITCPSAHFEERHHASYLFKITYIIRARMRVDA